MSIPVRLWRILRGRLLQARERVPGASLESEVANRRAREALEGREALAEAMRELAGELAARRGAGSSTPSPAASSRGEGGLRRDGGASAGTAGKPGAEVRGMPPDGPADRFAEERRLLKLAPDADLAALEAAYRARLAEAAPEQFAVGSPERAGAEARRAALVAAYERLRDALNATETRFEKLEF